jgi:hypothetical protein
MHGHVNVKFVFHYLLKIHGLSQFQTTEVLRNAYMHKIFGRSVLATCGVSLSLERSGFVAQRCMGLIERKHGIFFSSPRQACPLSTVYQQCSTTCSEHNCPVPYIFHSLFG